MRPLLLRLTASTALALTLAAGPVLAQGDSPEFEKGVEAFDAGKYKEAIGFWEPLAEQGNVEALRNLAQLHRLGLGVQQDDAKAFELYEKAAERGLAAAQVNAAFLLLTGKGVEQDRAKAATWFAKAADQGNALAQYNLGLMYEKGIGVKQNEEYAVELYSAAADQGQKRAIARLEALDQTEYAGSEKVAGTDEKSDGTEKVADAIATQGEKIKAEGERIESSTETSEDEKMAEASESETEEKAKRPRPNKADIAKEAEAAGSEMATNDSDDPVLSITPAKESEEDTQPLEFEVLEASKVAPTETGMPAYKPVAENGAEEPKPVYTLNVDAGKEEESAEAPLSDELMIDLPSGDTSASDSEDVVKTVAIEASEPSSIQDSIPSSPLAPSDRIAQVKLAEAAYEGKDFARAASLLMPLSEAGMPIAQFWMGRLYNRGEGVDLDRAEAYSLWRSAAASGSNLAATALANLSSRLTPDEIAQAEERHASSGRSQ